MNLREEIERIIKEISNLPFKEKIQYLIKAIEKAKEEDLKIILYLYLNYLIQQHNEKGGVPFTLPPLNSIKELSRKIETRNPRLQEILAETVEKKGMIPIKRDLYAQQTREVTDLDKTLYAGKTSGLYSQTYQENKTLETNHVKGYINEKVIKDEKQSSNLEREAQVLYAEKKDKKEKDKKQYL